MTLYDQIALTLVSTTIGYVYTLVSPPQQKPSTDLSPMIEYVVSLLMNCLYQLVRSNCRCKDLTELVGTGKSASRSLVKPSAAWRETMRTQLKKNNFCISKQFPGLRQAKNF